jgi:hypothetical protein
MAINNVYICLHQVYLKVYILPTHIPLLYFSYIWRLVVVSVVVSMPTTCVCVFICFTTIFELPWIYNYVSKRFFRMSLSIITFCFAIITFVGVVSSTLFCTRKFLLIFHTDAFILRKLLYKAKWQIYSTFWICLRNKSPFAFWRQSFACKQYVLYHAHRSYYMSKQNVLGAKQKVLNDKIMLKKRFET